MDSVVLPGLTNLATACLPAASTTRLNGCSLQVNRLQLNHAKMEILWCASQRRQHLLPTRTTRVCELAVSPTRSVRDLGVYIDAELPTSCALTSRKQSVHASLLFVRLAACDVLSQDTPCYHWSVHLLLARLITVTRFWPEYPEISYAGYSPS